MIAERNAVRRKSVSVGPGDGSASGRKIMG
jgi:hypothetical protein